MNKIHKGQVLFPTLLVIPMLMLFVFLLYETTKLSREKIRHQFAVDSAAFIQMGDFTNLFNRTAYVNGVFPYRIFKEAWGCVTGQGQKVSWTWKGSQCREANDPSGVCMYDMVYEAGAFPRREASGQPEFSVSDDEDLDNQGKWEIRFFRGERKVDSARLTTTYQGRYMPGDYDYDAKRGENMNKEPITNEPTLRGSPLVLITGPQDKGDSTQVKELCVMWDGRPGHRSLATHIYQFYVMVYQLLGQIAESQINVFEELTKNSSFFRKSYYLNGGCENEDGNECGREGVSQSFGANPLRTNNGIKKHFVTKVTFCGKVMINTHPTCMQRGPYDLRQYCDRCAVPVTVGGPSGLFQLATIDSGYLEKIGGGFHVYQSWSIPSNFFNIRFDKADTATIYRGCQGVKSGQPCVHALVASQCPGFKDNSRKNNCVWPDPTPKYQTRLYP